MKQKLTPLAIALLLGLSACSQATPEAPAAPAPRPVPSMTIVPPTHDAERIFSGTARAAVQTVLSFRVPGEIAELDVEIGSTVQPGEVIARLDDSDYTLGREQLEARLAQVDAQLRHVNAEYERIQTLYAEHCVSRSVYDQAQAAAEATAAGREAVAKSLALADKKRSYCTLKAPAAGRIGTLMAEVHQTVGAGTPVATLTMGDHLEVEIGLPETLINHVHVGDRATIVFDALPNQHLAARVSEVGATLTASTTYPVRLTLDSETGDLHPGMVAEVNLALHDATAPLTVPSQAVFAGPGPERFVWVVDKQTSTVHRRTVSIGQLTSRGLQIRQGLTAGETIAIRGVHHLHEGQQITIQTQG